MCMGASIAWRVIHPFLDKGMLAIRGTDLANRGIHLTIRVTVLAIRVTHERTMVPNENSHGT